MNNFNKVYWLSMKVFELNSVQIDSSWFNIITFITIIPFLQIGCDIGNHSIDISLKIWQFKEDIDITKSLRHNKSFPLERPTLASLQSMAKPPYRIVVFAFSGKINDF